MSVYKKLMDARLILHSQPLKKSGRNAFANYDYWELSDYLPQSLIACSDVGLCPIVSFDNDYATMRLVDVDTGEEIVITSPMGSAALKGCHEVQNIGAVETYQSRYLWQTAMQIVERDALEATTGRDLPEPKFKIDDAKLEEVQDWVAKSQSDVANLCKFYKVNSIKEMTPEQAQHAITAMQKKVSR